MATVRTLLAGRKLIILVDNEAACAALAKGAATVSIALISPHSLWAIEAKCIMTLQTERAPLAVDPGAHLLLRQLSSFPV